MADLNGTAAPQMRFDPARPLISYVDAAARLHGLHHGHHRQAEGERTSVV